MLIETLIERWEFGLDKKGFAGDLLEFYFDFTDDL